MPRKKDYNWALYDTCSRCGSISGVPCKDGRVSKPGRPNQPVGKPHPERKLK